MLDRLDFRIRVKNPISAGIGLVALDVVMNGKKSKYARLWAGGSCGNIMIILSYLGWLSYPIAYLGKDFASKVVLHDLRFWGVKTDFIFSDENTSTPIVIERINNSHRKSTHGFEFKCPCCGSQLPRSRPVPTKLAPEIMKRLPAARVFYFDRVSRSALRLAEEQKSHGALIVFEPYNVNKRKLFKESLEIAHIVKYSAEQIKNMEFDVRIPLEIQTLGFKGLRYRFGSADKDCGWRTMVAFRTTKLVDAAGAGDWCTAGIVHKLGQRGSESFFKATRDEIENALRFGQSLAVLNCIYEGARGMMYNDSKINTKPIFRSLFAHRILRKLRRRVRKVRSVVDKEGDILGYLCPSCANAQKNVTLRYKKS